ncbi:hypothetical protein BGX24_000117 [Mortierella sp. AD032]|nr:hypothetical protein BGX24_000117 [Mortierella sp. AD032]
MSAMSKDIITVLSKITPEKRAFLDEAWLAYQEIPDVSTLKFFGALMDLEFEIVRYWFYCRSNHDGIMRAFAQSAARGSSAWIVLPVLEEYHLLDKFSEEIERDYRRPEQDVQELELEQEQEEPTSISSTPVTNGPQCTLSQQRRKSSDAKQPSDSPKAQITDTRNTENRRVKTTRRQSKNTRESADKYELAINDESECEVTATLGSRGTSHSRVSGRRSTPSLSFKQVIQQYNDEHPKKSDGPLGSSKKYEVELPPRTQTSTPTRYPTPTIVIPRLIAKTRVIAESTGDRHSTTTESILSILFPISTTNDSHSAGQEVDQSHTSCQSTEPIASELSAPTLGVVENPVEETESRRRFLKKRQRMEEQERRTKIRVLSKAPTKAGGNGVAARAMSSERRAIYLSEENYHGYNALDYNAKNDCTKDDSAKDEVGGGSAAHHPYLNNSGYGEKMDRAKSTHSTLLRSTPSFYKEFASIKPKLRPKQLSQEQPPVTTIGFDIPPASIPGEAPQQVQLPINRALPHFYDYPACDYVEQFNPAWPVDSGIMNAG